CTCSCGIPKRILPCIGMNSNLNSGLHYATATRVHSSNHLLFGSRQVDRRRSRVAIRARRARCSAERAHESAGVLLQDLAIDILSCVAGPVIAGIIRATRSTAEQLSLLLRLPS